jgi:hypothetical protein
LGVFFVGEGRREVGGVGGTGGGIWADKGGAGRGGESVRGLPSGDFELYRGSQHWTSKCRPLRHPRTRPLIRRTMARSRETRFRNVVKSTKRHGKPSGWCTKTGLAIACEMRKSACRSGRGSSPPPPPPIKPEEPWSEGSLQAPPRTGGGGGGR